MSMATKSLITVAVVLLLSISIFISFSGSQSRPISIISTFCSSTNPRPPPLKVFMYDLPRRLNFDMIDGGRGGGGGGVPEWPERWGVKKQHSVEYWLMASLMVSGESEVEAVRVFDEAEAEVFFVPFFSSMSFNNYGRRTDSDSNIDRMYQVDVVDFLSKSKYWQRSGGRDHVIPMHHPNAFKDLRDRVSTSMLVVVDFGRYPRNVSSLSKDVVTPYVHVVDTFTDDNMPDPFESRHTLLFFRGRMKRKAGGRVRKGLSKILEGIDDIRIEETVVSEDGIKTSSQAMRSSKFCLHPAGDTPSSCRLFDAIASHCIPVIISDRIELPFEDELDYSQFSLFFATSNALQPNFLVSKLREVTKERWVQMWSKLKNISHHFEFQYPPKAGDGVNMLWRQVRHKLPSARLDLHRSRRLTVPDWWNRR